LKSIDAAPAEYPTVEDQVHALNYGLGRAVLWAREGKLDKSCLLNACLIRSVRRSEIEVPEGEWFWKLINTCGLTDQFEKPILDALTNVPNQHDLGKLCDFALQYAHSGESEFRKVLRRIALIRPAGVEVPQSCEDALMELDGLDGFMKLAAVFGKGLKYLPWKWPHNFFMIRAERKFGKDSVKSAINRSRHSDIVRFRRAWIREERYWSRHKGNDNRSNLSIGVDEILKQAQTSNLTNYSLRSWGEKADDEALLKVARATSNEQNPHVIERLLPVFFRRDWPENVDFLVSLCSNGNRELKVAAFIVLSRLTHPQVRDLGLSEAAAGFPEPQAIECFEKNFVPGDESLLFDAITLTDDVVSMHAIFQGLLRVLECNPEADHSKLALAAYLHNPCGICRSKAVLMLLHRNIAPTWLIDEGHEDSSDFVREAVETGT
jgi:hypothetical protein